MRRRLSPNFHSEQMERGTGKGHSSRIFCLASLTASVWILLLYFHLSILGGDSVDKPPTLQSEIGPFSVESTPRKLVPSRVVEVKNPDVKSKHEHLENLPLDYSESVDNEKTSIENLHRAPSTSQSEIGHFIVESTPQKLAPSHVIEVKKPVVKSKHEYLENPPPVYSESVDNDNTPIENLNRAPSTLQSEIDPSSVESTPQKLVLSPVLEVKKPDVQSKHEHLENPPPDYSKSVDNDKTSNENLNRVPPMAGEHKSDSEGKFENYPFMRALQTIDKKSDPCGGRYIYVHNLPSRFNEDMLKECRSISMWTDMCKFTTNAGMGPPLENTEGVFSETGWYATNQFAVDVIFGNRMKQYECLTNDSSIAAAIFVPFYAGFDISRYLWGYNTSMRDSSSLALIDWLMKRPEWKTMGGSDHFLVAGRITWDFRRLTEEESDWGSKLLFLPAAKNMSMLVVESSPWNSNDFGIPYPTYFHPAKDSDVFTWQDRMRNLDRKWLFSFAGAPRPGMSESIRGQIIEQCKNSKFCKLLECNIQEGSKCHSPSFVMQMFQNSLFCLQPQGDSYTRRSAFDSMLAGCIPVFFHPGSAYVQYTWHLPKNYTKYSVFIPEDYIRNGNFSIEEQLGKISPQQVKNMREEVINLIPGLVYADPRSKLETLKDAFDLSVQAIINKVTHLRKDIIEGRRDNDFIEEYSWKISLLEEGQKVGSHEWDPFFSYPKDRIANSDNSAVTAKNSQNEQRNQSGLDIDHKSHSASEIPLIVNIDA